MSDGLEAVLEKNERGPLDRFRNESLIYKQFGDDGVRVYAAISPGIRARDLLAELGMNEMRLIELLEFMDTNGLVSIKHGSEGQTTRAGTQMQQLEADNEIVHEISEREHEVSREKPPPAPMPREQPPYGIPPEAVPPGSSPYIRPEQTARPVPSATDLSPAARPYSPGISSRSVSPSPSGASDTVPNAASLSPLEKTIYQKFGKIGLTVYNLIDGEKTAEEILSETGISEVKLVEILEFMDKEGIIKLEKPEEEKDVEPERPKPRFEPMLESKKEMEETLEMDVIPIDLPVKQKLGFVKGLALKAELFAKFRNHGLRLYDLIDGQKDVVQLSTIAGISFDQLDLILGFLGKRGAALMKPLKPKDARVKYGEDGLAIYRNYGRDGVLIYELIGKEDSVRDIVLKSKIDRKRAVDIFIAIHKVLGLELPIDRQTLLKQLK